MPHDPTSSGPPHHTPTVCYCCGRRAHGIGMEGFGWDGKRDPHWLCELCIPIMQQIKAVVRFDAYETRAIDATIEAVGALVGANGTDLGDWSEDQVREFVSEIILQFGHSIRKQIREQEVPF